MEMWYYFSILAAVFFGIQMIFIKIMLKEISSELLTTLIFSTTSIMLWVYIFSVQKIAIPNQTMLILLLITTVITVIANLAAFKAISLVSNPGYHTALSSSLNMVIIFALSLIIFSLKPNLFGVVGITFIIIGVVFLSRVI